METKVLFEENLECPHCKGKIVVRKERKVLEEAVKAEYEDSIKVIKDTQMKLDDWGKKVEEKKNEN